MGKWSGRLPAAASLGADEQIERTLRCAAARGGVPLTPREAPLPSASSVQIEGLRRASETRDGEQPELTHRAAGNRECSDSFGSNLAVSYQDIHLLRTSQQFQRGIDRRSMKTQPCEILSVNILSVFIPLSS